MSRAESGVADNSAAFDIYGRTGTDEWDRARARARVCVYDTRKRRRDATRLRAGSATRPRDATRADASQQERRWTQNGFHVMLSLAG